MKINVVLYAMQLYINLHYADTLPMRMSITECKQG